MNNALGRMERTEPGPHAQASATDGVRTLDRTGRSDGADAFVRIVDIVKRFGATTAVDSVSLSVRKGELFALLGSSGCGKSTLLRMLAGLETPTSGRIEIGGVDLASVPTHRRPTNMMFQSYALFPHMSVEANVGYGLRQERVPRDERRRRVDEVLDLVQMSAYRARKPHQLSGGQQQRVALARSLVKRPKLLLLDEPMSALDKKIRQQTQFELGNILQKVGVTCVMVTHDQDEAMTMADRIAVMDRGRIVQIGAPEAVYERPANRFTADFIGTTNLFDGTLADDDSDRVECAELGCLRLHAPVNRRRGATLYLSIRPECVDLDVTPAPSGCNVAQGSVAEYAYMGSYTLFHVRLPSGRIMTVNVSRTTLRRFPRPPAYGDCVFLSWDDDAIVVLEP
ncbi:ABC transporter ATP-binding protein [Burkholderia pseudomultivorans]|uniref:Spermidine/putrescine import ATP-binding protein PotA n=1 Tax=Burkholderia pseudomultivorans TaxID=1207504 RepID=A0ABU2E3L7_9BURK|nr:ABC transporter ATP-binding protein [Burkholderia pseudomultivorans]MDR8729634.1 Spermidine/putrescine import ATP-binding protein PotA [Burkholderia pseudomultivorans]MDR8737029.1 Spermidine/putrescine import ATP-binding protein PotA [Burkholderia pseudomultivorans]MDR8743076.1 Spermidine/putrescine import ATP-binding protein PotA [Burkholderia pseudomultivorans]MDR8754451.1 Spermidine/putrescine import ATP-binding protein PotA [Burkholderia pseudomultivorans]MDR8779804.1 Spermidine/putresc